jgi:Spy/CpxP family protein refolding chaperone
MKKEKFFMITTFVLLLLNTATLIFLFKNQQQNFPGKMEGNPGEYIIRELDLDASQQKQFEVLRRQHQEQLRNIRDEDRRLHDVYFGMLKTNFQQRGAVDSITSLISARRKQAELALFDHFAGLRAICNPSQNEKLNSIIDEIARRLSPKPLDGPPVPHP